MLERLSLNCGETQIHLSVEVLICSPTFVSFRGMLRRPKPTDSEADLLRDQEQFLISGAPSAASVLRRPDKRRGELSGEKGGHTAESEGSQRDVVTIEGKGLLLFDLLMGYRKLRPCVLLLFLL